MWLEDVKMSFLNWRPIIYNGDLSVCVHYGARSTQTGAVSEVRPADTEVCVFYNEIYRAPDVPGYEDVCRRFRRVRPAPCQCHSGVLFYCLSPPTHHS